MVRRKFIEIYLGFQWYAAHLFWMPVVRRKFIQDSSGTPQIALGFQWYAADCFRIPVVRRRFISASSGTPQIYLGFQ